MTNITHPAPGTSGRPGRSFMRTICTRFSIALAVCVLLSNTAPGQGLDTARVTIFADSAGPTLDGLLWGSNVLSNSVSATNVENPEFIRKSRQLGIRIVRWPGGNQSDNYDWKRDLTIAPGKRVSNPEQTNIQKIIRFVKEIGAELSVTINFGTMTAQDAADMVEFCNGPATSTWGRVRANLGFPDPLNVRYFEIGNEENQPHMWYYSWTAENPYKYFFGGDEERRGRYPGSIHDPVGFKGDFFKADGGAGQTYHLRFPPVRRARVFWSASKDSVKNGVFTEWKQLLDLSSQPADAEVFTIDEETGTITFGDGTHGRIPPAGSYFLVEYTTIGHKGYVDFARAMRAAPSSVPILIGAATVPFVDSKPIASNDSLRMIFDQIDFLVTHNYNASFPYDTYQKRRQFGWERTRWFVYRRVQEAVRELGMTKLLGIGVTEWNIFLDDSIWELNRTLEGGIIAAEYFTRVINGLDTLPVWHAEQFALHGGSLALINTQKRNYAICPMGYVFEGFKTWRNTSRVISNVESPEELAYDRPLPLAYAAAARSTTGDTLFIALVNTAESKSLPLKLFIHGFKPGGGKIQRLEGASIKANNDVTPGQVVLSEDSLTFLPKAMTLQPHSVVFLTLYRSSTTGIAERSGAPNRPAILSSYPQPATGNSWMTIEFDIPPGNRGPISLELFSILGRKTRTVLNRDLGPGRHRAGFDAGDLPNGIYIVRLKTDAGIAQSKVVIQR